MSAGFDWLEEWRAPGICLLARSKVVPREPLPVGEEFFSPCGLWLLVHGGEALLLEAPFAAEDASPILSHLRDFLEANHLWLKFFTVSHLHHDHAAGLGEVAKAFRRATFVHPEEWLAHRKGRSADNLERCTAAADEAFERGLVFGYDKVWEFALGGEPVVFLRAPYHSPTDQLVVFRGVAIRPDWHLPSLPGEPVALADADPADKRASLRRVLDFNGSYGVHSHLAAHGDGELETDFVRRVELALASLETGSSS